MRPGSTQAPHQPEHDTEHAAAETEDRGLDQELAPDRSGRRPECLAQPDLARALGDRDEHDVHDPDAADEQ
ncbi:MAG TPA: hypothetical protein VH561_13255 [Micromonosporaceae bacterium]|jgi:hypothetical protein